MALTVKRQVTTFLDFAGHRKDGKAVRSTVPQFDGSMYAGFNCAAASEAVRDIVQIAGGAAPGAPWEPTGATIRNGTGDHVGGLRPSQTAGVSWAEYRIPSDIRIVDWNVIYTKLWARYAATILVSYRPIANAGESGSPGFYGTHSGDLLGIRSMSDGSIQLLWTDPLRDGRRDGIPEGPKWLDASILKRAASDLILDSTGTTIIEKYGSNHAFVSFTTEPYKAPPPPPAVVLRFGARKIKAKRVRTRYARTIIRNSPRRILTNHEAVVAKEAPFLAYQRVDNKWGAWLGNKAGTRWVFRPGVRFAGYI